MTFNGAYDAAPITTAAVYRQAGSPNKHQAVVLVLPKNEIWIFSAVVRLIPMKRFIYWLPALSWAGLIFFLSTLHANELPPRLILLNDKVVHAILFGTFSLTICFAVRKGHDKSFWLAATVGFLVASLYGASDEIHQLWTPSRTSDVMDWVADTSGAACAFLLALLPSRHEPAR